MLRKLLIGLILLIHFQIFSQNTQLIKGNLLYEGYSFIESIEKYEALSDKTIDIKRKLAHAYFNTENFAKTEIYFSEIVNDENRINDDIYNYAAVLLINERYTEAEKWMKVYYENNSSDSRGEKFANNAGFYKNLLSDKNQFKIKNININSEQQDFGTSYFNNKIVYASTKQQTRFINRKWNWNRLPYLNMYTAEKSGGELSEIKAFNGLINKKYHDGPATFNESGTLMVFTRNNYLNKSQDGVVKLQLYFSELKDGNWQDPTPFLYNSKEYSLGHAALSADGKTMYFASDMPGGFGGVDLYKAELQDNGSWSNLRNLGKNVNTEGNEMFPFIHNDGYLFFSSNGLLGLGGLDIFMTKVNGEVYSKPINPGFPLNSSKDDFAFIIDSEMKTGYFSSNREGGKGSDDIYSFKMLKPFGLELIGTALDQNGNILAETQVVLFDENGKIIGIVTTDESGKYSFNVEPETKYKLKGKKEKFIDSETIIDTEGAIGEIKNDIVLEEKPDISFYCIVKDRKTNEPVEDVSVILLNKETNLTGEFVTKQSGDFIKTVEGKKLKDDIKYKLILSKDGYMSKSVEYNKAIETDGSQELIVFIDKVEVGMDLNDIIEIKPIYFDLNKYNIRPDASIELDKIVKVMNENPQMVVELGSHTDSRGSDSYNLKLSDRRAKSSAKYIKANINNPDRIYGKGYGELKLKNKCKNGVKCSEELHQENRRTEFKIIKR